MKRLFKSLGQEILSDKRVLEINPSHPLIEKIAQKADEIDSDGLKEWATLLIGLASIADGEPVENSKEFTKTLACLLEKA
jgi:molecular chaperone HtpG